MSILPFAGAASLLIWVSVAGAERVSVFFWALVLAVFGGIFSFLIPWQRMTRHSHESAHARRINRWLALVCLAVFVSVPLTHWPLRLAYQFSRPSFEIVARSLRSGAKWQQPMRVGWFTIEKAEIDASNGKVCLWTDLNPSGKTGFVRCPPINVPFNLWSMIELDENWQYISED